MTIVVLDAIFRDRDMDSVMQEIIMYLTRPKASVDLAANPNRRAIHREMLFTAIAALGSNRINIGKSASVLQFNPE